MRVRRPSRPLAGVSARAPASPAQPRESGRLGNQAALARLRNQGRPLDTGTRAQMEALFDHSFEDVRVHDDTEAARLAAGLGARAFTSGADIGFAQGRHAPGTGEGARLLAHELAHVVQQQRGGSGPASAAHEQEAERAATDVHDHRPARVSSPASGVQLDADAAPSSAAGPPVIWGLDVSREPPHIYMSVAAPGHSLAEIAGYVHGGGAGIARLHAANPSLTRGDAEPLPPGTVLLPGEGPLSSAAHSAVDQALGSGLVMRTSGLPREGETLMLHTFSAQGVEYRLTDTQFEGMLVGLSTFLVRMARVIRDSAQGGLRIRRDFIDDTNSVVRGISNLLGGTSTPDGGEWANASFLCSMIIASLSGPGVPAQETVSRMARLLDLADRKNDEGDHAWMSFISDTTTGAERAVTGLEVTRNVSFAVAAGIGGAVAAPAVFGAVMAAGGSTLVAGGAAIGGGAVVGGTIHGGLEGSSTAAGQLASTGTVDWSEVGGRSWAGFKSGLGEGAMGAGSYFAGAGLAARLGPEFAATLRGRMAIGGAVGSGGGFLSSSYEAIAHPNDTPAWQRVLGGTALGGVLGSGFSALPVTGVYRTGGSPLNPFSGTPTVPSWAMASPWSLVQNGWNAPTGFHELPASALPALPRSYVWARVSGQWVPLRPPAAEVPLELSFYPDASGRPGYNLLSNGRLLGSSAFTRPTGALYAGSRNEMPFDANDFRTVGTNEPNIVGHNRDFADTPGAPGAPGNSNADPLNYTPEAAWWGLRLRNWLVQGIRQAGGGYRQANFYSATPRMTRVGIPIPDGVYFVETNAAGLPVRAWRVPFNAFPYNHTFGSQANGFAALAPFRITIDQLPPVLLSSPVLPTAGAAGQASHEVLSCGPEQGSP